MVATNGMHDSSAFVPAYHCACIFPLMNALELNSSGWSRYASSENQNESSSLGDFIKAFAISLLLDAGAAARRVDVNDREVLSENEGAVTWRQTRRFANRNMQCALALCRNYKQLSQRNRSHQNCRFRKECVFFLPTDWLRGHSLALVWNRSYSYRTSTSRQ